MHHLLVGIGGVLGSVARYQLGTFISKNAKLKFSLGTFLINISGAILLGIVSALDVSKNLYLLLADGFLGAYTTFSTFTFEGISLFRENEKYIAFIYLSSSLILGAVGFAFGFVLGRSFI